MRLGFARSVGLCEKLRELEVHEVQCVIAGGAFEAADKGHQRCDAPIVRHACNCLSSCGVRLARECIHAPWRDSREVKIAHAELLDLAEAFECLVQGSGADRGRRAS